MYPCGKIDTITNKVVFEEEKNHQIGCLSFISSYCDIVSSITISEDKKTRSKVGER